MEGRQRRPTVGRRCRPRCALRPDGGASLIAVDTNVLVDAHRRQAPQHAAALTALRGLGEGSTAWGIPLFVLGEFLRVVTHPRLFDRPSSPRDALAALEGALETPSVRLLSPGARYWMLLRETVRDAGATATSSWALRSRRYASSTCPGHPHRGSRLPPVLRSRGANVRLMPRRAAVAVTVRICLNRVRSWSWTSGRSTPS